MSQLLRLCRIFPINRSVALTGPIIGAAGQTAPNHTVPRRKPSTRGASYVSQIGKVKDCIHDNSGYDSSKLGRFVQNKAFEMAARRIRFNMEELKKAAAAAVQSTSCDHAEMYFESTHSIAFLLAMDDGKEAVAKIPYPIAGPARFTVASEVATMDLMRHHLKIPVPKVHGWCNCAELTPVGSEYIIMARPAGVPLQSRWKNLKLRQRGEIMKELARFQTIWSSATFEGYGSIYYASDLKPENSLPLRHFACHQPGQKAFALGPITGNGHWNEDGRLLVKFDRGPWKTIDGYMKAIGHREAACIEQLPKLPPTTLFLCGPGTYEPTRAKKLRAVRYYLQLWKHLMPSDTAAQKPSAWHSNLRGMNIFVDPSDHTKITDLVDWGSTVVAPLFVQACQPGILDHEGPEVEGLDPPELPEGFEKLSREEQNAAGSLMLDQCLPVAYRMWTKAINPDIYKCLELQKAETHTLLNCSGGLLVQGEVIITHQMFEFLESNPEILKETGIVLPENFVAEVNADAEGAVLAMQTMEEVKDALGDLVPKHGRVSVEQYEQFRMALKPMKEQVIERFARTEADRAAWEELWPFDD